MKVIVPCGGRSSRYPNQPPKWMLPAHDGRPMLALAVAGIPVPKDDLIVTILREHEERYHVRQGLAAAARREPMYARVHAVLLACTFVRILPYARTPEERRFVRARVEHFARMSCAPGGPG